MRKLFKLIPFDVYVYKQESFHSILNQEVLWCSQVKPMNTWLSSVLEYCFITYFYSFFFFSDFTVLNCLVKFPQNYNLLHLCMHNSQERYKHWSRILFIKVDFLKIFILTNCCEMWNGAENHSQKKNFSITFSKGKSKKYKFLPLLRCQ